MDIKFEFIGWCHEDNHDKVWALLILGPKPRNAWDSVKYVTLWGRRGKKLQHKVTETQKRDMDKLVDSKHDKGYSPISRLRLDEVYPEFENDLQSTAVWAMLAN